MEYVFPQVRDLVESVCFLVKKRICVGSLPIENKGEILGVGACGISCHFYEKDKSVPKDCMGETNYPLRDFVENVCICTRI